MSAPSFFDSIDSITGSLIGSMDKLSTTLATGAGATLVSEVILLMLSIEIMLCFIMALNGSGQQAISKGIEGILFAAFIYGLTLSGGWTSIVKPIVNAIPEEVITAMIPGFNSSNLKSSIAFEFAKLIQGIMSTFITS